MHYRVVCFEFNSELNSIIERQELDEWQSNGDSRARANREPVYRSVLHSLNRFVIAYLSRFNRMDLIALPAVQQKNGSEQSSVRQKMKRHSNESIRWRDGKGRLLLLGWPNLLLLIYLCSASYLLVAAPLGWQYDVNKIRLQHLKQLFQTTSVHHRDIRESSHQMHTSMKAYEACLTDKIEQFRTTLKWLGSSYAEWSIVNESVQFYSVLSTLIGYLLCPFWHNYHDIKDYPVVTFVLDPTETIKSRAETVRAELNKFIESSRLFTNSHLCSFSSDVKLSPVDLRVAKMASLAYGRVGLTNNWSQIRLDNMRAAEKRILLSKHLLTIEQLKIIVLNGRMKCMKRDPLWLDLCALITPVITLSIFTWSLSAAAIIHQLLDEMYGTRIFYNLSSYINLAPILTGVLLMIILLHWASFFVAINSLNVIVQFRAVGELKPLIYESMRQNSIFSRQLLAEWNCQRSTRTTTTSSRRKVEALRQAIDLNLLTLVVRYRLFYREFMQVKRTFTHFGYFYTPAVLSLPIIIRLLATYMDSRLRPYALGMCFIGCIPLLCFVAPLCQLHSRCLSTYKAMSSLLAQLIEFGTWPQLADNLNFRFIECSLRKELAYSQDFWDKFAVRAVGISLTYSKVMRIVFWLSIIMLSLLDHGDERSAGLFSTMLKDPLGLSSLKIGSCQPDKVSAVRG